MPPRPPSIAPALPGLFTGDTMTSYLRDINQWPEGNMHTIDIPRCHFCERIAPDFQYKNIHVCERCIVRMSAAEWVLYRKPDGELEMTPAPNYDVTYPEVKRGMFSELWALLPKRDTIEAPTHCPTCSKPVDADSGWCTHCGER